MKPFSLLAISVFALSGSAYAQTTYSQTQSQGSTTMQTQTAPAADTSTTTTTTTTTQTPAPTTQMPAATTTPPAATTQAAPATPAATTTPAPIVKETKVDLTTEPGPPADMRAAREEAVNALAWAKSEGCRSDPAPRDCVRKAQDDYKATMARLGNGRAGTVSASGTSEARSSGGARTDRN